MRRRLEERFWDLDSRIWDDSLQDRAVREHVDRIAGLLGSRVPGGFVVDLGCGTGNHLEALRAHGVHAVGADRSARMLDRAATKHLALARADLAAPLPFRDRAFDGALCVYAAQFLDLGLLLDEVRRVVRPEGSIVVELPRPDPVRRRRAVRSLRYQAFDLVKRLAAAVGRRTDRVRLHAPAELRSVVAAHGFEEVVLHETTHSTIVVARRPSAD